jgi:proline dehydrogenase
MLRSLLIYLSKAAWARKLVTSWKFAWRAASRFVAGEKLEDAIAVVKKLNEKGINATLDHLGEHTTNAEEARKATRDVLKILDVIRETRVRSNVSLKLTQIGLAVDESLCAENLKTILERAREVGSYVRIDMEDSPWVDKTLGIYRKMRFEYGLENVGVVIQAYLFRSEQDILKLRDECTGVRLCKGAYKEPPDVAFPAKKDVDANFDHLARLLMDGARQRGCPQVSEDGLVPPLPGLATHDEVRIRKAREYAAQIDLDKRAMEFQMLNGIRRDLQDALAAEGFPVRIYVPYGTEWYPYFMRRLAERPANVWFFISNFFRG